MTKLINAFLILVILILWVMVCVKHSYKQTAKQMRIRSYVAHQNIIATHLESEERSDGE